MFEKIRKWWNQPVRCPTCKNEIGETLLPKDRKFRNATNKRELKIGLGIFIISIFR